MSILAVGDLHFKSGNALTLNIVTNEVLEIISKMRNELDCVVILGDILDRHEKVDLLCLTRASRFLIDCRKAMKRESILVIIIGNHDRPHNSTINTDEHPFNLAKLWDNTIVCDDGGKSFTTSNSKIRCMGFPYVPPGRFFELFGDSIKEFKPSIIFAHQEFKGSFPYSECTEEYPDDGALCISGHIHTLNRVSEKLIYTGTPYFDDFVNVKYNNPTTSKVVKRNGCVMAIDAGGDYSVRKIPINGVPCKLRVIVNSIDEFKDAYDEFKKHSTSVKYKITTPISLLDYNAHIKKVCGGGGVDCVIKTTTAKDSSSSSTPLYESKFVDCVIEKSPPQIHKFLNEIYPGIFPKYIRRLKFK